MQQKDIVEMQVVEPGTTFSLATGDQICDSNYPNNVHQEYQLESGESVTKTLDTQVSPGQEYEIRFFTADECFGDKVKPLAGSGYRERMQIGETGERNGVPVVPIAAVLGFLLLIGGVYRKYG